MTQQASSTPQPLPPARGMNFLQGAWQPARGAEFTSENPATGEILWQGHESTPVDVDQALQSAQQAAREWRRRTPEARLAVIGSFEERLAARADDLARLISREVGKPIWEAKTEVQAMQGKVAVSIDALKSRRSPQTLELGETTGHTRYKPLGVLAVFGPFNFPGHISNGQILPALLAGNTVVLKPSELTPRTAECLIELWAEAGLPAGVLNLLQGGRETGEALVQHPGINGVLFTGSLQVGRAISRTLADRVDVLLALELGGNNPLVVHQVSNVEAAVHCTIRSAFLSGGQRCTCARRLIVPAGNDAFIEQLIAELPTLRVASPDADPEPFFGPLIHARAVAQLLAEQQRLCHSGGVSLVESQQLTLGPAFVSPGLIDITEVPLGDRSDEELFGPLLQLIRVPDFSAAIAEANRTQYGLVAGLLCDERSLYEEFWREVDAGLINWNMPTSGASGQLPFGGTRLSGNHRPAGYFTIDYCNTPVASMELTTLPAPQ